ncbi:Ubiquitin fusion degradation protein 1-like protein [Diplonema papillatum]|nr:Ubiquitin fusion degradation protein 1-like protein [Diplonema papillatum]
MSGYPSDLYAPGPACAGGGAYPGRLYEVPVPVGAGPEEVVRALALRGGGRVSPSAAAALVRVMRCASTRAAAVAALRRERDAVLSNLTRALIRATRRSSTTTGGLSVYAPVQQEAEVAELLETGLSAIETALGVVAVHDFSEESVTSVLLTDARPGVRPLVASGSSKGDRLNVADAATGQAVASCFQVRYDDVDELKFNHRSVIVPLQALGSVLGRVRELAVRLRVDHNIPAAVDVAKGCVFYSDREAVTETFAAITGLPAEKAVAALKQNRYNLDLSLSFFYEYGEGSPGYAAAQHQQQQQVIPAGDPGVEAHDEQAPRGGLFRGRWGRGVNGGAVRRAAKACAKPGFETLAAFALGLSVLRVETARRLEALSVAGAAVSFSTPLTPPYAWHLTLSFSSTACRLQTELARLPPSTHDGCVHLSVFFTPYFPEDPPTFSIASPRFTPASGPVAFNGVVYTPELTAEGWARLLSGHPPGAHAAAMEEALLSVYAALAGWGRAAVDVEASGIAYGQMVRGVGFAGEGLTYSLPNPWLGRLLAGIPSENNLRASLAAVTVEDADVVHPRAFRDDLDRISLPSHYASVVYGGEHVALPLIFEIRTRAGKARHCGISETGFDADLEYSSVLLPSWLFADLLLCAEAPRVEREVSVRSVSLPLVTFVELRPHSKKFYEDALRCESTALALQRGLRGMAALTEGASVNISFETMDGLQAHRFEVVKLKPGPAVRLVTEDLSKEVKFEVGFVPSPDHEEPCERDRRLAARKEKLEQERQAEKLAEARRAERAARKRARRFAKRRRAVEAFLENLSWGPLGADAAGTSDRETVEIAVRLPNSTQRLTLYEGVEARVLFLWVSCRTDWAAEHCVLPECIRLVTVFPKREEIQPEDVVTRRRFHRQTITVETLVEGAGNGRLEGDGMGDRLDTAMTTSNSWSSFPDDAAESIESEAVFAAALGLRQQYYAHVEDNDWKLASEKACADLAGAAFATVPSVAIVRGPPPLTAWKHVADHQSAATALPVLARGDVVAIHRPQTAAFVSPMWRLASKSGREGLIQRQHLLEVPSRYPGLLALCLSSVWAQHEPTPASEGQQAESPLVESPVDDVRLTESSRVGDLPIALVLASTTRKCPEALIAVVDSAGSAASFAYSSRPAPSAAPPPGAPRGQALLPHGGGFDLGLFCESSNDTSSEASMPSPPHLPAARSPPPPLPPHPAEAPNGVSFDSADPAADDDLFGLFGSSAAAPPAHVDPQPPPNLNQDQNPNVDTLLSILPHVSREVAAAVLFSCGNDLDAAVANLL